MSDEPLNLSNELLKNEELDVEGHLKDGADEPEDKSADEVEGAFARPESPRPVVGLSKRNEARATPRASFVLVKSGERRSIAACPLSAAGWPPPRSPAGTRTSGYVELAWGAAISAEWAYFVALGVFAYHAGGASAVGLAGLIRLLPAAFIAPGAASLGDRFRRERLLLAAMLLGAFSLACSAVAAFAGSESGVLACAALVGISSTLIRPTLQALLPSLTATPEELVAANAATSTVESVGTLIGPLIAGVLVDQASVGAAFSVAAATLAVGVCLVFRVHTEGPAIGRAASADRPGFAWRTVGQHPGAPVVVTLMVAQAFVRGCLNVLIVVAAFELLDGAGGTVGALTAAIGAGGVVGAVLSSTLRSRRLARIFALSLFGWGIPILLVAPSTELPPRWCSSRSSALPTASRTSPASPCCSGRFGTTR